MNVLPESLAIDHRTSQVAYGNLELINVSVYDVHFIGRVEPAEKLFDPICTNRVEVIDGERFWEKDNHHEGAKLGQH